MTLLLLVVGSLLYLRAQSPQHGALGTLVEVRGDVPRPGLHAVSRPSVHAAVRAAGGTPRGEDQVVRAGWQVIVGPDGIALRPPADPLLVALPIDVNTAEPFAISAIPGVGDALATRISEGGPYYEVSDLLSVPGVGPEKLAALRPFITVGEIGPRPPINLNTASSASLETLPGVGPVTAARIVVDRQERGPYLKIEDITRVRGIGPKTAARIAERAVVR